MGLEYGFDPGMYVFGEKPYRVSIGAYVPEVIDVLGAVLAERAGPQVFSNDGGLVDDEITVTTRSGLVR